MLTFILIWNMISWISKMLLKHRGPLGYCFAHVANRGWKMGLVGNGSKQVRV